MASKAQRQLDFPVRKSSRTTKSKTSQSGNAIKANDSRGTSGSFSLEQSMRNDQRRVARPRRERPVILADAPPACKSPSKRKPTTLASPPTPPKSPCKSVKITSARSQSPSSLTYSEESDDEVFQLPVTPANTKHEGAKVRTQKVLAKNAEWDSLAKMSENVDKVLSLRPPHGVRSPSKRKCENVPPLPTPPQSPFRPPALTSCPISRESALAVLPSTPTKTPPKREQLTPQKLQPRRHVLSPKKVPHKENEENFILKSPKKPLPKLQIAKQDNRCYQAVKQSLHTAKPDHLVGREQEVADITEFLKTHLEKQSAGSLYISGAPGTGKTAALLHIIDEFKVQYRCQIAYLNCMMVKDVFSVFRRLYTELSGRSAVGRTTIKDMEKLVTTSKHNMILVLDEIDQLDSKNQEVLYRIFEWPSLNSSKLILIGVANALDLTDRILPRLQAKPRCRPKLLHFAPYTRDQIAAIINDRLAKVGESVVENSAIQFCARKVSAVAGDMRKALDVCRRAVEAAESEARCQTVLRVSDCNSPSKSQPGSVKKIGVSHISKVMSEVYGSSVQVQHCEGVPLQQKLLVCTLLLMVKTGKFKEVQLGKLHETYCKVCRRQQMTPVDQSEFQSLCVLLEARGVLGIKKGKETRLMKLTLRQDEKELEAILQDRILVSTILTEGIPK